MSRYRYGRNEAVLNPKAVREWAWSRGISVASIGAIPKVVISAYQQAHAEVTA